MSVEKNLQRVENALEHLARITHSRRGDIFRSVWAGVHLPRAAQNVLRQVIEGGPARISDLARAIHMSDAAVSRQVTLLASRELIIRKANPEDAREAIVHSTARGRRDARKLRQAADEIFKEQLASWSQADVAALAELTDRLVRDLRKPPGT